MNSEPIFFKVNYGAALNFEKLTSLLQPSHNMIVYSSVLSKVQHNSALQSTTSLQLRYSASIVDPSGTSSVSEGGIPVYMLLMIPAWKYNFLLLSLTECLTAYLTQAILQAVEQNQQRIFHSSTSKIKICRANSRLYYDLVLYRFHSKESKNVDAGPRKITSFPCGTLMTLLNEWMTDSLKKIGSNRIHPTSAGSTAPQTTACGPSSLWRCERQSGPQNGANAPRQQTWCFSQVSEYTLEGKKQNSFGHAWVAHASLVN